MKENIFTVENAKVAATKYNYYSPVRKGYLKVDNGIVFVTLDRVTINLKSQEVTTFMHDEKGGEYVRMGEFDLYEDPARYENGKPIDMGSPLGIEGILERSDINYTRWMRDGDYGYWQAWTFEDGEAKLTPLIVNVVEFKDYTCKVIDGNIPEHIYRSREHAYSCNEYKVTDKDGEEFVERGVNLRIALTPEQQTIIDELKALYDKAKAAGIGFAWDRDNCGDLDAYNREEVDSLSYEEERCMNGDTFALRDGEIEFTSTGICFDDYNGCDDYWLNMLPNPRQEKEWLKTHPAEND